MKTDDLCRPMTKAERRAEELLVRIGIGLMVGVVGAAMTGYAFSACTIAVGGIGGFILGFWAGDKLPDDWFGGDR